MNIWHSFLSVIRDLVDSENNSVKSAAKGALWKLEGEANHLKQLEAKEQLKDSKATTGDKS